MSDDALWDANDVARFLKVSRSWVYDRAQAGAIPCRRLGALVRFEPAKIRALGEEHLAPVVKLRGQGG